MKQAPAPLSAALPLLAAGLLLSVAARAQDLISVTVRDTLPGATANAAFDFAGFDLTAEYDVETSVVRYTMEDVDGSADTVSGAIARPLAPDGRRFPRTVYLHGTTQTKFDVPSREPSVMSFGSLAASLGYVVLSPDFLGMGDDEGFHPYVHARTEGLAAVRMLQALAQDDTYAASVTERLFLAGYSQGGHASMATHELIVEEFADEFTVTAAAHMSGPYSISTVMKDSVILRDTTFRYPSFLPYTILAYQTVYPELERDLSAIFRAPYVPLVERFRDEYEAGTYPLRELNADLLAAYVATEGDSTYFPGRYLDVDFFEALRKDEDDPFNVALRDNDVFDFDNPTPTQLLYCRADDQVSYLNSLLARDSLLARGAAATQATDVGPGLDHGDCIRPAITQMVAFFEGFREATDLPEVPGSPGWTYLTADGGLRVYTGDDAATYRLELVDALGRVTAAQRYRSGAFVPTATLPRGLAVVRVADGAGRTATRKLLLR